MKASRDKPLSRKAAEDLIMEVIPVSRRDVSYGTTNGRWAYAVQLRTLGIVLDWDSGAGRIRLTISDWPGWQKMVLLYDPETLERDLDAEYIKYREGGERNEHV